MPRYNVKVEMDNKEYWCCYSSIVDYFVTPLMTKDEYEDWRIREYGRVHYRPAESCNMMSLVDALRHMSLCHSAEEVADNLRKTGIFNEWYPGCKEDVL